MEKFSIFNIKAIALQLKGVKTLSLLGAYTRLTNAAKGNTKSLTVPLIDATIKVIESDSKELISNLLSIKKQLMKDQKATKKAA